MLDFTVVQNPFRFGLAEGIEPHQTTPGTLLTAENVVWTKAGRLEKRQGTTLLTSNIAGGGTIAAASRLFTRGTELCLTDSSRLYSYSAVRAGWVNVGPVNEVMQTWAGALDTQSGIASVDVTYLSGVLYYAWTTGDPWNTNINTDLWFQAVDATSGAILYGPSRVVTNTTFGARVLVAGTGIVILTRTGAASPFSISASYFDTTTFSFLVAFSALKADNATNSSVAAWDACMTDSSTLVIGYNRTGATVALESFTVANTGVFTASQSGTVVDAAGCRAIAIDGIAGERLYVVYCKGGAIPNAFQIAINNVSTLAATVATANVDTPSGGSAFAFGCGVARYNTTQCVCWVNVSETNGYLRTTPFIRTSTGTAFLNGSPYYSTLAITRPFVMNGKAYFGANLYATGTFGGNSGLLCADEYRYYGAVDLLVGGTGSLGGTACAVPATSATSAVTALPFQSSVTPAQSNWRQGARLVTFTIGASKPTDGYRTVTVNQELFAGGGGLMAYDGNSIFDYGFASAPVVKSSTATGSGNIAAGTYLYSSVSEFRSRTGLYYRSPAAVAVTQVTTTASSTNTLAIISCNVSNKPFAGNTYTTEGVYRTTAGGTAPQRLSFEPRFNTVYVDRNSVSQPLVDARADASIDGASTTLGSRPAIYTTGSILDDFAAPSGVSLCYHVDRLWVLAGDQKTWWYSKAFQDDLGTAPGFNSQFRIVFADVQTAMASMDDKAVFFSATGIKYMQGTGPAPSGANSDFQTPTSIQSDVGCTNARSVVNMPDGVMFLSDRGIYLLDRGLNLTWIGRQVKDHLAAFPVVTSAVLVAKQNQVRLTCNNVGGTAGITLVFDYVEKQWTTFAHGQGVSGASGIAIADACMWNGAWTFVTPAGAVYTETPGLYLDNAAWVPVTLETAWMTGPQSSASPSAGPLKFQSVRTFTAHGVSNTDHDLTVQCGFDSEPTYAQSITFPATGDVTLIGVPEDFEISIGPRRKCNAIRFKINDASPSNPGVLSTGQGPSFDMMALEVGMKRGTGNTPATRKG